jgi:excisionase family DNA binding protein
MQIGEDMATTDQEEGMLTVKEVARLLHVHPNTLRRWADKGIIGSLRITPRGDRRFLHRDIDRLIADMNSSNHGSDHK